MIFHSIRWRLQLWYGLILVAVLAGFGLTAYQLERGRQFRRIDDELRRRVNALVGALHPGPPGRGPGPPGDFPAEGLPPGERRPPRQGPRDFDNAAPGAFPPPLTEFRLPPRAASLFDESDTNGFYFVIWAADETTLLRSTNAPDEVPFPERPNELPSQAGGQPAGPAGPEHPPRGGPPAPAAPRQRDAFREAAVFTPREVLLAGRSVTPELGELRRTAMMLAGVGGAILLLGLAGGWWLAGRAIRPIEDISATALKISSGDLSRRIDVADTENELGRLAQVLNSTFARLEAAFAQQQQFTSDAAHELRTPVSVMLTQIQTALSRERSAGEFRETVAACERAAQRMRRLIESLLELARLDAGQETLKRAPFDLARVVADSVELVRPLAQGRGLTIHADLAAATCPGDAERLGQVVTNLLTNSIQYNKEGGEVHVTVNQANDFVVLTVADTGSGIAPEHLPHVFERFYRGDPSRTGGAGGGTGLGLAISKAIVAAHGGSIEAAARAGGGSTFTVRLPAG